MNQVVLQSALALRRAGKLAEAAQIYADVLRSDPKHFEALHALGILRYQCGELGEAERLIGEADPILYDVLREGLVQPLARDVRETGFDESRVAPYLGIRTALVWSTEI